MAIPLCTVVRAITPFVHSSCTVGTNKGGIGAEMNLLSALRSEKKVGGRDRDRTGDPLLAKQVLSQLSYTPTHNAMILMDFLPA